MGLDKKRILHSLGVANKMKVIANELYPGNKEFIEDMFILGLLHDLGYEFAKTKLEHSEIGGTILKKNGYKYWKEVYYHGKTGVEYKSEELKILNTADLLTDSNGREITAQERLKDVKDRYGEDSFEYIDFVKLAKELGLIQ